MITMNSMVSPGHSVSVDPYGRNPLAEDYRQVNADTYAVASSRAGPPPKMFTNGTADAPAFTASGIDPQLLLQLPFSVRHAVAANPDVAAVHGIFEQYAADPYAVMAHEGLDAAIARVRDWAAGRMDTKAGGTATNPYTN